MNCITDGMNYSLLNGNNFRFYLMRAKYLNFFVQSVSLPSISLGAPDNATPFNKIPVPGDELTYDPLVVTFAVDEDLNGYKEVHNWMRGLGFPTTFEEYQKLVVNEASTSRWQETTSDIQVVTMTGSRNMNILFNFVDAFPVSLTAPTLSTTNPDQPVLTCTATFTYTTFDITSVKNS